MEDIQVWVFFFFLTQYIKSQICVIEEWVRNRLFESSEIFQKHLKMSTCNYECRKHLKMSTCNNECRKHLKMSTCNYECRMEDIQP